MRWKQANLPVNVNETGDFLKAIWLVSILIFLAFTVFDKWDFMSVVVYLKHNCIQESA